MTRWFLSLSLGLALAVPAARADDPPRSKTTETKADDNPFAALAKDRAAKRAAMVAAYREAKDDERDKVYAEWQKADKELAARLSALAFEHAATRPAYEHLIAAFARGGDEAVKAGEAIRTHHLEKPYAAERNAFQALSNAKGGEELVRLAEAKNANPGVKAAAAFALGSAAKGKLGRTKDEAKKKEYVTAAEAAFGRVKAYDDGKAKEVKAFVAQAAGQLAGLKNLDLIQVGKPVPEIEGIDTEGKPFKLSDYKGKVILIDYWAFW
jgi:hypothetical protein